MTRLLMLAFGLFFIAVMLAVLVVVPLMRSIMGEPEPRKRRRGSR